jgi:hypothetical protein
MVLAERVAADLLIALEGLKITPLSGLGGELTVLTSFPSVVDHHDVLAAAAPQRKE